MTFKTPLILLFIPLAVALILWFKRRTREPSFTFSSTGLFEGIPSTFKVRLQWVPFALRAAALVVLIFAWAGPRAVLDETPVTTEGIDIVLALDCSGSMAIEDYIINGHRQNRLDAIKGVVREFIDARKSDRLALVAFGSRAYTVCPLTTDHDWLKQNLGRVVLGIIEDGTAIGSGISSSLLRFKDPSTGSTGSPGSGQGSKAKSRIIVLLTDGVNNAGNIDPLTAARTAKAVGVKIYTIGAGSKGLAPFPVRDGFGNTYYQDVRSDLDEDTLRQISDISGGEFFRAADTESLRRTYAQIDRLEKTDIRQTGYKEYRELFGVFIAAFFVLVLIEIVLANTLFLKVP